MYDFQFHSPTYLALLVFLPVLAYVLAKAQKGALRKLELFASAKSLQRLLKLHGDGQERRRKAFFWTALALAVIALARPQANPEIEERESASLDILVLLDVSKSMDAEDEPPSRLKKAKKTISDLMDQLSGDRVGVVAFAGSALLVSPLTADYDMVRTFLQGVDSSIIQNQGTNIGSALDLARRAMERGSQNGGEQNPRSNVFLILSDGEDHYEVSGEKAAEIRKMGGVVFTIALGTERGAPIPLRNERGESTGYKRDAAGTTVLSATNRRSLQAIAAAGGGQSYSSTSDESEIFDILRRTQGMQRDGGNIIKAKIYQEYFFPFLVAAAACLLLSFLRADWIFPKRRAALRSFALFLLFSGQTQAGPLAAFESREKREYEQSLELSKEGKPEEAAANLRSSLAENPDSGSLNYNVGTFLLEAKKYKEAREHLERAKRDDVTRWRAAYNVAGSHALEQKKDDARAGFSEIISTLSGKESLSKAESELLEDSRLALQQLSEEQKDQNQKDQEKNEDQKNQDQKGQDQKQDQKGQQGKGSEDKKDQSKDPQGEGQDQKNQEKKGEKPDQGDSKENQEPQGPKEGQKKTPGRGRPPFRERDDMSEDDAKKILEALKQQETGLQKRFLKNKEKNAKKVDDNGKDW